MCQSQKHVYTGRYPEVSRLNNCDYATWLSHFSLMSQGFVAAAAGCEQL